MDIFNRLSRELYYMTDTVIDDWIDKMILFRITNAYIHDCRNEVRRSQLQIRQDEERSELKKIVVVKKKYVPLRPDL